MKEEEWRYVPNFPEYVVSDFGRLKRAGQSRGRPLSLTFDDDGHAMVAMVVDGDRNHFRLDRIVAFAFLGAFTYRPRIIEVYHKDGDLTNCRADNLTWREE